MPRGNHKPLSEETKRKISEANKGRKRTPEQRARISESIRGNNNGSGNKGKTPSPETRLKLSIAGKRRIMTQETREKLSKALKGNRNPAGRKYTPETLKKISESNKGQKRSLEWRVNNSKAHMGIPAWNKGIPQTKEAKAKMSLAAVKAVKEGRIGVKYIKKPKYVSKSGQTIQFRSSWEYKVAEYLDKLDIIWEYELEILRLGNDVYLPDFFIFDSSNNLLKMIEVKGYFYDNAKAKFDRFQRESPIPLELWDKRKLEELGVL